MIDHLLFDKMEGDYVTRKRVHINYVWVLYNTVGSSVRATEDIHDRAPLIATYSSQVKPLKHTICDLQPILINGTSISQALLHLLKTANLKPARRGYIRERLTQRTDLVVDSNT